MEISKETRKRMMQIIAFGILLYCGMEHFDVVIGAVDFVLGIVMPFLVGGKILCADARLILLLENNLLKL